MRSARARLLMLLASLPLIMLGTALVYQHGMAGLEGEERGFWQSLAWATETLTTTGYGIDGRWEHPAMNLFVMAVQWTGVFLVFLIFPIFLIPLLAERFETRLPQVVDKKLSDHLVIYGHGPPVASLLEQVSRADIDSVVIEEDEATARRLFERGQRVVYAGLDDGALEGARLAQARALIVNSSDEINAAVILAARQLGFDGEILALVEEPLHRRPMQLAGADRVFTPRHALGAALAARASAKVSPKVAGIQQVGRLQVHQIRVQADSSLAGKTLREAQVGAKTGAVVIGQWVGGTLQSPLAGSTRIEPGAILVLVGTDESLETFVDLCTGAVPLRRQGCFVVAGYGEVGKKVVELLEEVGEEVRVLDLREEEGVDVVGNLFDGAVVEALGLDDTQAVIVALDSDSATLFGTVILKEAAPDVPVIARVNRAENVERLHRAGADFALSISQVAGQILAHRLLGEESVAVDVQLKILKTEAGARLVGHHPSELEIRELTGTSVVGVERGEELILALDGDFRFAQGDTVYLGGPVEALDRYQEEFG